MTTDLSARAEHGFQRRTFTVADLELRADADAKVWTFEGIAATVDHPYTVRDALGEFTETMARGAFDKTLAGTNNRIGLYVNHNWRSQAVPLATRRAGTLTLTADPHLRVSAELDPARPDVQIMRSAITRGEMAEMSVGFNDVKDGVIWSDDFTERTVTEAGLREVSVVDEGANDATHASIRSVIDEMILWREADLDEAEIGRAITHLTSLLPEAPADDESVRVEGSSGLVVTAELIELFNKRHAA